MAERYKYVKLTTSEILDILGFYNDALSMGPNLLSKVFYDRCKQNAKRFEKLYKEMNHRERI